MSPSKPTPLFLHLTTTQVREFVKIKSEHDLRLKVKDAFFGDYSVDVEDERIDFLVYHERTGFFTETFLWAESKDKPTDTFEMFAQLLLTIKKKVDTGEMPPEYLGVFDREKIAFVEYYNALDIFRLNDFNWSERPSSVSKKTVNQVTKHLNNIVVFNFEKDTRELIVFIRENFVLGKIGTTKAQINKNNFVTVFMKWAATVRPTIDMEPGDQKEYGLIDGDFYLGDLLSEDNVTLSDFKDHKVALQKDCYRIRVAIVGKRKRLIEEIGFRDGGKAHQSFWNRYERPPKEEFRDYMKDRRDLLVPQDIRERKGSFFTPQIWVEKSQEYLAKVFGVNWQDEYYVWDCCCGTGNLLVGLVNPHNVWASTIDQADIDILHASISNDKCNLLESHVFPFDFLNGSFDDLPEELRGIINDPKKNKKLIIYMNPPYAEVASKAIKGKVGVNLSKTHEKYSSFLGTAGREVFALFLARIYFEIPGCKIATFSTLKPFNGSAFDRFREFFVAKHEKCFIIPAYTFDNVKGQFPIGFNIWDTNIKKKFKKAVVDVFDANNVPQPRKTIFVCDKSQFINKWIAQAKMDSEEAIGFMDGINGNDFAHNNIVYIINSKEQLPNPRGIWINKANLFAISIYFAVRRVFEHTWINHNDQFLYPNDKYQKDREFQNDCLIYALFHGKNRIRSKDGLNHWIPFTAREVNAKDNFKSTFMSDFLKKKKWSKESKAVLESGKALWIYYHEKTRKIRTESVDASLYEIREFFKERNKETGRINTKSKDDKFTELDSFLKSALQILAEKIQPKVYEYGFLKK